MLASKVINRAREGFIKAGYGSSIKKNFTTASSFN